MNKSLSNHDIKRITKGRVKVIRYNDLNYYPTIESALHPYGALAILYPGDGDVGHWVCLYYTIDENGRRVIEFYDSYGIRIDHEFKYTATQQNVRRRLAMMLYNSPLPIHYNQYKVQTFAEGINTCGRHVCLRLNHRHMPLKQFINNYFVGCHNSIDCDNRVLSLIK